jgi:alpha-tubulin suppressor-like RCC1 family protein
MSLMYPGRIWFALSAALALSGCGGTEGTQPTSTPPPDQQTIGPSGGSLRSRDNSVIVAIPPGAVSQPTAMSLVLDSTPIITDTALGRQISPAIKLSPDGMVFDSVVTITVKLPPGLQDPAAAQISPYDPSLGLLWWQPSRVDLASQTVTTTATHFSTWISWLPRRLGTGMSPTSYTYSVINCQARFLAAGATCRQVEDDVNRAVGLWMPLLRKSGITIVPGTGGSLSRDPYHINVRFYSDPAVDVQAFVFLCGRTWLGLSAFNVRNSNLEIFLNDGLLWSPTQAASTAQRNNPGIYNVERAVAHEMGHQIGLGHIGVSKLFCWQIGTPGTAVMGYAHLGLPLPLSRDDVSELEKILPNSTGPYASTLAIDPLWQTGRTVPPNSLASPTPSVLVTEGANPIEGVTVVFDVTPGSGTTPGRVATTNDKGVATVPGWIVGSSGPQQLQAYVYPNSVTFDATVTVTPPLYTISTSSSPSDGGSTSGGGTYTEGSSVTVTANVASGYAFVKWTENGPQVSSSATYNFTASANRSLVANFSANPVLTVIGSGTGSGSVTSDVGGISCSITAGSANGSCSASFNGGTSVMLTATPVSGHTFAGWSGACSGTGNCQVTMTQVQSVTASFTAGGSIVFAQVTAGGEHTCGLTNTGVAQCWGDNRFGQLGDGTTQVRLVPTPVSGGLTFVGITAGVSHTCGRASTGAAYCWGNNSYSGAIGDGTKQNRYVPTPVSGGLNFVELTAGYVYTCGRTSVGTAYCWGTNNYGEVGDGTTQERLVPTPVGGGITFIQLTAGTYHTCGLTSTGAAYCWGNNSSGELGVGDRLGLFDKRLLPTPAAGGIGFTDLTAALYHTCGRTSAGAAYCWGSNGRGELGDGTTQRRLVPTLVSGGFNFVGIKAGSSNTCALKSDGAAYCWGDNFAGQLGNGTQSGDVFFGPGIPVPTAVSGNLLFIELTVGSGDHTCGRTGAGTVYCWGYNGSGQLGDGTQQTRLVPTPVKSP